MPDTHEGIDRSFLPLVPNRTELGFIDAISGQVAVMDRTGRILAVNADWRQFARENGYCLRAEDAQFGVGVNYLETCDLAEGPDAIGAASVAHGIRMVQQGLLPEFLFEYPCHSATTERWFKCCVRAMALPGSPETYLLMQHTDITAQRKTQQALKNFRLQMFQLFETVPVRVACLDRNLRYRYANRAFADAVYKSPLEILGLHAGDVLGEKGWDAVAPHVEQALQGHVVNTDLDFVAPVGRLLHANVTCAPDSMSPGAIDGIWVLVYDLDEHKTEEQKLHHVRQQAEAASDAKSTFLAGMCHDLRTPLNAIIGFAQIMENEYCGCASIPKYKEFAGHISSSGRHLLGMMNDLMDLSAIEAGKRPLDLSPVKISETLKSCELLHRFRADDKNINLSIDIDPDLAAFECDERALRQIIINLLTNAMNFTPEGGHIRVSARETDEGLRIRIADTGSGIPAEKLIPFTPPYYCTHGETEFQDIGWGLGLSITKSLVDLHGGRLEIESEEGKGTSVTLILPGSTVAEMPRASWRSREDSNLEPAA